MEAPARAAPDPERTLLHAIPPNRPVTLPFVGGAPRQVLPFDDAPLLRPRTVDVAREAIARDPLPFKPIASDDEEDEEEPRTLRPPAPRGPVATETVVPPAPPAPRFGLPPATATPTFGLPAATPKFGLPATATPTFGLPPAAVPAAAIPPATPAFGLPPAALPPSAVQPAAPPPTPLVPPPATPVPAKSMFAVREETVVHTAQTPLAAPAKSMFAVREETVVHTAQTPLAAPAKSMFDVREETVVHTAQTPLAAPAKSMFDVREETVVHTAQTPLAAPAKSMFDVREETVVHTAQTPLAAPAKSMFDVREETVIHSTTGAHRALPFAEARMDAPAPRIPAPARPTGGGDSTGTLLPSRLLEPDEGRSAPLPFAVPGAPGSAAPVGVTPPPWAASLAAAAGEARPLETKQIEKIGLLTLEEDAEIRLALWDSAAPLHETLEKHGIDELKWREHRRLCDAALREEAESGGEARALAVHEALENAKKKRAAAHAPSLDVATYAAVRAVILEASDEPSALASRGIDPAVWAEDHLHYRRRLLKEPGFAEEFRKALETAATQTASPDKPSPSASTGAHARAPRPNPPAPSQSRRSAPAAPKVRKIRSRSASGTRSNRHA